MDLSLLFWLAVVVPLLAGIVIYNRLVEDRNRVRAAWSDIEVQLKRRHELIPKLVEVVRQVSRYEQSTLEKLVAMRQASQALDAVREKAPLEAGISQQINRLLILAEAYPELKADASFLELQRQISEVENAIQHARRYYNGAVKLLNVRIASFPDLLVARLFRFRPADYFSLDAEEGSHAPA